MSRVSGVALLKANEIHDVQFSSRVGEQPGQVPYAPHISQAYYLSLEDHQPVIAFAPEDIVSTFLRTAGHSRTSVRRRHSDFVSCHLAHGVRRSSRLRRGADAFK